MSGSNPSLESQLANDFRMRANLASPSASSLGRHGASSMSLHDPSNFAGPSGTSASANASSYSFFDPRLAVQHGQGSAPTSPYGQPQGRAVAMGQGIGRQHPYESPSHDRLPGVDGERDGYINPIFRVVSVSLVAHGRGSAHGWNGKAISGADEGWSRRICCGHERQRAIFHIVSPGRASSCG